MRECDRYFSGQLGNSREHGKQNGIHAGFEKQTFTLLLLISNLCIFSSFLELAIHPNGYINICSSMQQVSDLN